MRIVFLIIGIALIAAGDAAARQLVVVKSSSPSYRVGKILDQAQALKLGAGKDLTVVGEDGKVTKLTGPFSGVLNENSDAPAVPGDRRMIAALSRLVSKKSDGKAVTRTMRSGPGKGSNDPWVINLRRWGDHCVQVGKARFWRVKSPKKAKFTIRENWRGGKLAIAKWPRKTAEIVWPKKMPLTNGAKYRVKVSGLPAKVITTHLMPNDLPTPAHKVAWMSENGCEEQALNLLRTL
jgi:hypothetical protein